MHIKVNMKFNSICLPWPHVIEVLTNFKQVLEIMGIKHGLGNPSGLPKSMAQVLVLPLGHIVNHDLHGLSHVIRQIFKTGC